MSKEIISQNFNKISIGEKSKLAALLDALGESSIPYHPAHTRMTGSLTSGLLLSLLYGLSEANENTEFCKTDVELRDELGMGRSEFMAAKKKLRDLGLITVTRRGLPAKSYYKVNPQSFP